MNQTLAAVAGARRRLLGGAALALSFGTRTIARNRVSIARIRLPALPQNRSALRRRRGVEVALAGMPPRRIHTTISLAGRCPALLFYLPVLLHCLRLAWRHRGFTLPSVANPNIECGGFRGESKMSYLEQIAPESRGWVAPSLRFVPRPGESRRQALCRLHGRLRRAGLCFPLVAKPDIGSQGYGVRLVATPGDLAVYLERFPSGAAVILQRYIDWQGEAGILYVRRPDEPRGRIFSLGFRCFPHVIGDGRSTLGELIDTDPRTRRMARRHRKAVRPQLAKVPGAGEMVRLSLLGSVRAGAFYYDGQDYVTPALTARIDAISRRMPAFHFGRFDVRFESVEALRRGEGFQILEVNGASAEALHIWDPDQSLTETYRVLFDQFRLLYEIGACNRDRGHRPIGLAAFLALQWRESSLLRRYPESG